MIQHPIKNKKKLLWPWSALLDCILSLSTLEITTVLNSDFYHSFTCNRHSLLHILVSLQNIFHFVCFWKYVCISEGSIDISSSIKCLFKAYALHFKNDHCIEKSFSYHKMHLLKVCSYTAPSPIHIKEFPWMASRASSMHPVASRFFVFFYQRVGVL